MTRIVALTRCIVNGSRWWAACPYTCADSKSIEHSGNLGEKLDDLRTTFPKVMREDHIKVTQKVGEWRVGIITHRQGAAGSAERPNYSRASRLSNSCLSGAR